MQPTHRQLQYFATAARTGTFAAAAMEHHIAQPSLSEQIASLERTLEVPLFSRTPRGLLLTDVGKQLLPLAERALADVDDIVEVSRRSRSIEAGTVSFGTFNSAHLYLLTDVIRQFREEHPGVRISVVGLNSAEVANAVRDGRLEAGLVQLPIDDRELRVTPTVFVDQAVYVSPDARRADGPIDIATLATRPLIMSEARWAHDDPLRVSLLARAQAAGVALKPVIEVEFQTHALELAAQGIGDTLVSFHVGSATIEARGLHWAPLDPPVVENYAFVTRRSSNISPATRAFAQLARRILSLIQAGTSGR